MQRECRKKDAEGQKHDQIPLRKVAAIRERFRQKNCCLDYQRIL